MAVAPAGAATDPSHVVLARLLDILAPGPRDLVTFFEAYFDESYSDKDPRILAVAGYVFEKSACLEFDLEVKALLDPYGLPFFHMVECAHGSESFKHLDVSVRIEIEKQMISLVRKHASYGVAFAINQDDHRSLFPEGFFPPGVGLEDPYTYCCQSCLTAVQNWLDRTGFDGKVGYFFEAGHPSAAKSAALMDRVFKTPNLYREYRYEAHGFVPKTRRPVQAADMLAWLHYTDVKNLLSREPRARRKDFIALTEGANVETRLAAREHLEAMRAQVDQLFAGRLLITGTWGNWRPFVATWPS